MRLRPHRATLAWLAVLTVATTLRLPGLTGGLPYSSYVDEGHLLHPVVRLLAHRTWDPGYYTYPSLPLYAVAAAALAWSPFFRMLHGRPLAAVAAHPFYDVVEPVDLLILGRLVGLAAGLGIVLLTRSLARRLAGDQAGLAAGWLVAWIPALVIRGAIVTVDPLATFFVVAALVAAERLATGPNGAGRAALAGACTGLAAVAKYPAALVCLPVALAIWHSRPTIGRRARMLLVAGGAGLISAVVAMPALVLRPGEVLTALSQLSQGYRTHARGSLWRQATERAEWDLPYAGPEVGTVFLVLALAGATVGLRDQPQRRSVVGWALFGGALAVLLAAHSARPFRNLLPLVPVAVVTVSLLYAAVRRRARAPRWVDAAVLAFPLLVWLPPLAAYERHQLTLEDSREEAVLFLAENVRLNERIFVDPDLAFMPSRLASLPTQTASPPWPKARRAVVRDRFEWLVLRGRLAPGPGQRVSFVDRDLILGHYRIVATFGEPPTSLRRGRLRGNRQLIYVLARRGGRAQND